MFSWDTVSLEALPTEASPTEMNGNGRRAGGNQVESCLPPAPPPWMGDAEQQDTTCQKVILCKLIETNRSCERPGPESMEISLVKVPLEWTEVAPRHSHVHGSTLAQLPHIPVGFPGRSLGRRCGPVVELSYYPKSQAGATQAVPLEGRHKAKLTKSYYLLVRGWSHWCENVGGV